MAGGPIFPCSAYPVTSGRVFPNVAAATNAQVEGLGVEASVGADSVWRLWFQMPPTLPSGTGKLRLLALANASSGNAKPNVKWKSWATEESIASPTLNAEGVGTVTWATGDEYQFKELKVTLDADTLVGGEMIQVDLTFETSSWTLAATSTWLAAVIWE